jgi:hypothetical protein
MLVPHCDTLSTLRPSKGPSGNNCTILAADASRRASLLVAYITPGMRAPCASPGGRLDAQRWSTYSRTGPNWSFKVTSIVTTCKSLLEATGWSMYFCICVDIRATGSLFRGIRRSRSWKLDATLANVGALGDLSRVERHGKGLKRFPVPCSTPVPGPWF